MKSVGYSRLIGVALIVLALLAPAGAARASTTVTNLTLSPHGDFTELAVVGGGSALCNHFTEPAADGRPFRIVLDFCDAVHGLDQMSFGSLPACDIARIRTSQFATTPQNVVRVVLDMKGEVTYSVQPSGADLVVRVVDPGHGNFAMWQADNNHTTMAMNKPADAAKPVAKPAAPVVAQNAPKPAVKNESPAVNKTSNNTMAKAPAKQPEMTKAEPVTPVQTKTVTKNVTPPSPMASESPKVAMEASMKKDTPLPPVPLVYAPDYQATLAKMNEHPMVAEAKKSDVPIAKVSMTPMGPKETPAGSENAMANAESSNKSLWASTNPQSVPAPTAPAKMATHTMPSPTDNMADDGDEYAMADQPAADKPQAPASLLDRLKSKFFGDQSQPRPYTTVGDAIPNAEVYGPPSPDSRIDREELLARIRQAKERASGRGAPAIGADGVPARTVLYYDDAGRRDPFHPLVNGLRSGFVTDELPNVETLRLVGILNDDTESLALLENMEGFGYILRVGDAVQNGKVIAIQNTRALFRVDDYGWSHVVALQLTSRGADPTKSLGAVQQQYPTYESPDDNKKDKNGSTGNQGSGSE